MQCKYTTLLSRSKFPVCFWSRPPLKTLILVAVCVCLIYITIFSLDFLPHDNNYLGPILFKTSVTKNKIKAYDVKGGSVTDPPGDADNLPMPTLLYLGHKKEDHNIETKKKVIGKNNLLNKQEYNNKSKNNELLDALQIKQIIDAKNIKQTIWNLDKFGPITNDTIIVLVQAYKRLEYLRELIKCLEQTKYIDQTLIIFSHGFYSDEINNVVQNITFARVLQIFFPYGLQTHPNSFPGFSPNDCPHGVSREDLQKIKCHGQPRDVKSLQVKHHWWWKVNMVFNGLQITRWFQGLVFLLEEDHYVFPDFLHMLMLMRDIAPKMCPECNLFGLGRNPKHTTVEDFRGISNEVNVVQWNNMGFAFDRMFWSGLDRCHDMFCEYNDYNWDFTVAYLSHKCLPHELKPLNVVSPRVFHIGDCGMHFHGQDCSAKKSLHIVQKLQRDVAPYLFPSKLTVTSTFYYQMRVDGRNGGWNDIRDIQLCKNISQMFQW